MSTADINRELDRLSYKPRWSFRAFDDPWEGQKLRIVCTVPDSYHDDGRTIDLGVDSFIPPLCDEWDLRRFVAWRVQRIEIHESLEFLKLDGAPIWNPHSPDA